MAKILIVLIIALMLEAVGVVFLSKGLKQIGEVERVSATEIIRIVKKGLLNSNILIGIVFEAIFFAGLLFLLSRAEVSVVWPLTSLGFVITTVAAKIFLHEQISVMRWLGVCLIVGGAALITWSDRNRAHPPKTIVAVEAQQQI
jgi:drug/metabolite transporter (DMT)-like permease